MKTIILAVAALLSGLTATAESNTGKLHISEMSVNKGDDMLTLNMTVDPKAYRLKGDDILTLTPCLVSATDSILMPAVRIAGKRAWYDEVRNGKATPLTLSRAGKDVPVVYSATIPYTPDFEESQIIIKADTATICNCKPPKEGLTPIAELNYRPLIPSLDYHYVAPLDSAEKIFNLSGRANVIFKVNRTEIDWSYAGNHAELDTILRTVNAVRDNSDATVEGIFLTGYASPEGSYANNVRLAKGRTEAVKDYVMKNATFPASIYHTSSVPEDWEGLREWIAASSIDNKEEMLRFIDDKSVSPEKRNDIFRQKFPEQYPFLLANVYPSLRHTDYRITYKIRRYYDVEEIRRVLRTNPRNLSLNELFLLANSCEPGSAEYDEAFEMAARLFPDNLTANLNAANSAMNRGNYAEAERYLGRAGDSPEAEYARGILALKTGDLDKAEELLRNARRVGIPEAQGALDEISRFRNFKGAVRIL